MRKQRDVILLTQNTNEANFFVEKYAIARDAQPFEKVDRARDATLFWRRFPALENGSLMAGLIYTDDL